VRIMQLSEMLTMLRAEARISPNVAHGTHLTPGYIAMLGRVQEEIYDAYHWPLLQSVGTVDLAPGERYSAYPEILDYAGIEGAYARSQGTNWRPLEFGIGIDQYNRVDSDAGDRAERVERWRPYLSPQAEQVHQNMFEVWPVPSTETSIRFRGKRKLLPLNNEATDSSTVDGPLIVLHAAAEILAGQKAEDAGLKLEKAKSRFQNLKARQGAQDNRTLNLASTGGGTRLRRGIDYIE
jgi:hypothetical protein